MLDPAIGVFYRPRGSDAAVFLEYHDYGYWRVAVIRKHGQLPGPRTLTALVFVVSLALLAPTAMRLRLARRVLAVELATYGALAAAAAVATVRRRRESLERVPIVATVFPAFHLGLGTGMVRGALAAAVSSYRDGRRTRAGS